VVLIEEPSGVDVNCRGGVIKQASMIMVVAYGDDDIVIRGDNRRGVAA